MATDSNGHQQVGSITCLARFLTFNIFYVNVTSSFCYRIFITIIAVNLKLSFTIEYAADYFYYLMLNWII